MKRPVKRPVQRPLFAVVALLAVAAAGCATTTVSNRQSDIGNEKIPRPTHIIVYDFAATPAEIMAGSPEAAQYGQAAVQTPEEMATGHQLGVAVANELVGEIQAMGLPGIAASQAAPQLNDILIKGYFGTIDEGSAAKRMILGFGAGTADLQTVVTAYQVTNEGLRRLGSGEVNAGGAGKGPGLLVPIAVVAATANPIGLIVGGAMKVEGQVSGRTTIQGSGKRTAQEIATQLKKAFQKQGWIQ